MPNFVQLVSRAKEIIRNADAVPPPPTKPAQSAMPKQSAAPTTPVMAPVQHPPATAPAAPPTKPAPKQPPAAAPSPTPVMAPVAKPQAPPTPPAPPASPTPVMAPVTKADKPKAEKPTFESITAKIQDPAISSILSQWKQATNPQTYDFNKANQLAGQYQDAIVKGLGLKPIGDNPIVWGYKLPAKLNPKQTAAIAKAIGLSASTHLGDNPMKGVGVSIYGYTPPPNKGFEMDNNTSNYFNLKTGKFFNPDTGQEEDMSKSEMIEAYWDTRLLENPNATDADYTKLPPELANHGVTQADMQAQVNGDPLP